MSTLIVDGDGHRVALLNSVAGVPRSVVVSVPGTGPTTATSYDSSGQLWRTTTGTGSITVELPPGGFAIAHR